MYIPIERNIRGALEISKGSVIHLIEYLVISFSEVKKNDFKVYFSYKQDSLIFITISIKTDHISHDLISEDLIAKKIDLSIKEILSIKPKNISFAYHR